MLLRDLGLAQSKDLIQDEPGIEFPNSTLLICGGGGILEKTFYDHSTL